MLCGALWGLGPSASTEPFHAGRLSVGCKATPSPPRVALYDWFCLGCWGRPGLPRASPQSAGPPTAQSVARFNQLIARVPSAAAAHSNGCLPPQQRAPIQAASGLSLPQFLCMSCIPGVALGLATHAPIRQTPPRTACRTLRAPAHQTGGCLPMATPLLLRTKQPLASGSRAGAPAARAPQRNRALAPAHSSRPAPLAAPLRRKWPRGAPSAAAVRGACGAACDSSCGTLPTCCALE